MVKEGLGSGVKHLARIASRPVTWVIKIKHAGLGVLGQKEIMKWTTLTFKELAAQRTLRMDAGYWIKKKQRAASGKPQASSGKQRLTCKWK